MRKIVVWMLLVFLGGASLSATGKEDPLVGITGVRVFVYPTEDSEAAGLTKDIIQTEVELMLRQYGIRVLTQEEYRREGAALSVIVNAYYEETKSGVRQGYFSTIILEVEEYAFLVRDLNEPGSTPHLVRTWETSRARTGPPDSMKSGSLETLENVVKRFANSYLAANPKTAQ